MAGYLTNKGKCKGTEINPRGFVQTWKISESRGRGFESMCWQKNFLCNFFLILSVLLWISSLGWKCLRILKMLMTVLNCLVLLHVANVSSFSKRTDYQKDHSFGLSII